VGSDEAERKKARDAWAAWWKENGAKVELTRLDGRPRLLGYTLVLQWHNFRGTGQLIELGRDGKPRWTIDGLQYPFDFQMLPGERVLIPEWNNGRVTERNFKGEVLWEMRANSPINCQRLPNGNTFIATRNQLLEVDKNKKEIYSFNRPNHDIMAAQKLRNGQIVMLTNGGMCVRLDAAGKEIKSFSVGNIQNYSALEALPNGRILVAQQANNKVVEYDAAGKQVWEVTVQVQTSAVRLPNGNTLVACQNNRQVVELDRNGKTVWQHQTDNQSQPWRARRR
jgi:outer membrane protein assembly factor BamB